MKYEFLDKIGLSAFLDQLKKIFPLKTQVIQDITVNGEKYSGTSITIPTISVSDSPTYEPLEET